MLRKFVSSFSPLYRLGHNYQPISHIATYKSQNNLENLYSSSTLDSLKNVSDKISSSGGSFSGVIPLDQLEISYSKSGGPGGQNVNKVNTKVEIRFHVPSAEWLAPKTRKTLMDQERNRITKDGFLIVSCDKTRKQYLNQADCLDKIRCFIRQAEEPAYEPTEDEVKTMNKRKAAAQQGVLREKRTHSLKKQARRKPNTLE